MRHFLIGTRAVGLRTSRFRKICEAYVKKTFRFRIKIFSSRDDSSPVETNVETGAIRSRSPEYDCGTDATLRIKEDHHVSSH